MSLKIPKIVHQIWFDFTNDGTGKNMGKHNKGLVKRAKSLNKSYKFILWDEKSAEKFMKKNYIEYWLFYICLTPVIKKVDYLRFFLIHFYGGIYLDIDYYCIKGFDDYFNENVYSKHCDVILSKSCYGPWVTNSIMMGAKNSLFFKYCYQKVRESRLYPWWGNIQPHIDISCTAGPYFMTQVYETYLRNEKIKLEEVGTFLSQDFADSKYTWHEGHTSWIDNKDLLSVEIIIIILVIITSVFVYNRT